MSTENPSHAELLALWTPYTTLAKALGVSYRMTFWWRTRGRIPPGYWRHFIAALAEHHGVTVTMEDLEAAYPARKPHSRKRAA